MGASRLDCESLSTLAAGGPGGSGHCAAAVIAPGTGLGISGLIPAGIGDFAVVEGEGGHRTLAAQSPREWAVVNALAERFGHASAERALSGPGIEAIRRSLASIDGVRFDRHKTAAEIADDAFTGADSIAQETVSLFTAFLGSVSGDLALTLGARGGVYIAGGIVPGWGERFDAGAFPRQVSRKGPLSDLSERGPGPCRYPPVSGARRGRTPAGTPKRRCILSPLPPHFSPVPIDAARPGRYIAEGTNSISSQSPVVIFPEHDHEQDQRRHR